MNLTSALGIASTLWKLLPSGDSTTASQSSSVAKSAGDGQSTDFSTSLAVRMAALQAQSVNALLGSVGQTGAANSFDFLGSTQNAASGLSGLSGLSGGRNLSLFDPESAYRMMTVVNNREVNYKAQYAELTAMGQGVATMEDAGEALNAATGTATVDGATIKTQLQSFVDQYNAWINRFDKTVQTGGVLDGTQAAEVSLYELEQSVKNIFNGAKDGFHGLADLGVTIDDSTNLASFDAAKFDAALSKNFNGVVNTVKEFSANFDKSAELLNADNNFITNRLANLDRVIDYIGGNKASLQSEFGMGDPAAMNSQVRLALAAYAKMAKA